MGKSKTINHHEIGRIGADTFENQHNLGMSRILDNDSKTSCLIRTIMKVRTHEYILSLIHGTANKSFVEFNFNWWFGNSQSPSSFIWNNFVNLD